jgi:hypothetical protein
MFVTFGLDILQVGNNVKQCTMYLLQLQYYNITVVFTLMVSVILDEGNKYILFLFNIILHAVTSHWEYITA